MPTEKPRAPRGVRNNNPGNIRLGEPWQGLRPPVERTDLDFCEFIDPAWGIRALARVLISYQDKYGLRTVAGIINRWAPANENNTFAYINAVCAATNVTPGQVLDMHDYVDLKPLVEAIIRHECGIGPLANPNTWYDSPTIDVGLMRAGVVKLHTVIAKVPVTKETLAASGTATLGAAQLAEVAPQVLTAIDSQQEHLSSGSYVRVVLGVMTIVLAGYIAYSQIKKHETGVVP